MTGRGSLAWSPGAAGALLAAEDRAGLRWRDAAECATADPEVFFPEQDRTDQVRAARRICARCPVQQECLEFALAAGVEHGIWAGTAPEDRHRLSRPAPPARPPAPARRERRPVLRLADGSKECSRCRQVKAPGEYCKDSGNADGLANWCRACKSRYRLGVAA